MDHRILKAVGVAIGLLALSGCKPAPPDNDVAEDVTQVTPSAEVAQVQGISAADAAALKAMGDCAMPLNLLTGLINGQQSELDDLNRQIVDSNAHQAAVLEILSIEIARKYDGKFNDQVANNFNGISKRIAGQEITGPLVGQLISENCNQDQMSEFFKNTQRILDNYPEIYQKTVDKNKNLRLNLR